MNCLGCGAYPHDALAPAKSQGYCVRCYDSNGPIVGKPRFCCAECGSERAGDMSKDVPGLGVICSECFACACIRSESESPDDGLAFDNADLPQWWRVQAGRPEPI